MTKRQTRAFFLGSTGVFSLIFIALTIDSHRQFPRLTHSDQITPEVIAGKHVWHRRNCINCHTLLGEGPTTLPTYQTLRQRGRRTARLFWRIPPSSTPRARSAPDAEPEASAQDIML